MVTELSFHISPSAKSEKIVTNTNRNNTRLKYFVFMTAQYVINNRGRNSSNHVQMGRVPTITENKIRPILISLPLSQIDQLWHYPFIADICIWKAEISISDSKDICSWFEISIWNTDIGIYIERTPLIE